jgi:hypothetical protein
MKVAESESQVRTWQRDADTLLSLLDCVVPEREAVFASSEFFTGKRFYELCLGNEVRTAEELEKKLGPHYRDELVAKNKQQGISFARQLREQGHKIVLTPVVFDMGLFNHGQDWSGDEYMRFWNLVIAKKCHAVYLGEAWEVSDSCVFHYIAGLKNGKKLLDHAGNFLLLEAARKMVLSATRRLEDYGFDVPNLHRALTVLKDFSSLG